MSSPELAELIAFDALYGFPDVYFLAAVVCSTLEGLWSSKPRPVGAVVPYFADGRPAQTGEDMAARLMMMARRAGPRRPAGPPRGDPPPA